jgi:SAM-dependent methyltransferase
MITDWNDCYLQGETPWNKDQGAPPLEEWLRKNPLQGRVIVPGCGLGHDVAMLASSGIDVTGFDIAPTAIEKAKAAYPKMADRFVTGDLFDPPTEWEGAFDALVEHTCLSGMPPEWRPRYASAVRRLLKPDGLIVGLWFINPDLDPGETAPPFPLALDELRQMFDNDFEIVEDYIPTIAFKGREGRERLRILRRLP